MWLRRKYNGGLYFALLISSVTIWAFAASMENASLSLYSSIIWSKLSYIGVIATGPLWFIFALSYTKHKLKFKTPKILSIFILPIIFLILVFTNEHHNLIWSSIEQITDKPEGGFIYNHSFGFYINTIYSYSLLLLGSIILAKHIYKAPSLEKSQIRTLFFAMFAPWIFNFIYILFGSEALGGVDLSPIAFSITGILITMSIFRYKLFSATATAKENIFKDLKSGLIILDNENTILDFNSSAKKILGDILILGAKLDCLDCPLNIDFSKILNGTTKNKIIHIKNSNKWYSIQISHYDDNAQNIHGKILNFTDITSLKKVENDLKRNIDELSKMNELMIARELKMVELKEKIKKIEDRS